MKVEHVQDAATLEQWQAVSSACWEHDHVALPIDPIEERLAALDPAAPDGGEKMEFLLGVVDGRPVAAAELGFPTHDNQESVSVRLQVLPDCRRQGHGTALLAAALEETASRGRPRVFFEVPSAYPSGAPLGETVLRAVGARPVLREVRRALDLSALPNVDAPLAGGYRLEQWVDTAPEALVEGLAYLCMRMSTDAPLGEMDWEPEVWDAARYREKEAAAKARGRTRYAAAAVHEATGQVVAMTDIGVSQRLPEVTYQWDTIVITEHRGHGLGLALKARNHELLVRSEPDARWINTWNAESNTHMIGINERLGYRPIEYWTEWQLDR